jgi:hypothetical protein
MHVVFPDGRIASKLKVFRHAYRAVGLGWVVHAGASWAAGTHAGG